MPQPGLVSTLLCRILLYTSLAYRTINEATFEISTPQGVAPHSLLFCSDNPLVTFTKASTSVTSLLEGGSIFDRTEVQLISQPSDWSSSSFFLGTSPALDPLEVSSAADALHGDEYYSRTYPAHWYVLFHLLAHAGQVRRRPGCITGAYSSVWSHTGIWVKIGTVAHAAFELHETQLLSTCVPPAQWLTLPSLILKQLSKTCSAAGLRIWKLINKAAPSP